MGDSKEETIRSQSVFISLLHYRNDVYPITPGFLEALETFAESPFFPVPLGVMSYFVALFPVVLGAIVSMIVTRCCRKTIKSLDLLPNNPNPSNMMLIWMQQTRREAELARLDRTAWTWLAKRYMMFPTDPLLNVRFIFDTAWEDFRKPRYDIWPTIKTILRVNALFHKVHRHHLLHGPDAEERQLSEESIKQRKEEVAKYKRILHHIAVKSEREKMERGADKEKIRQYKTSDEKLKAMSISPATEGETANPAAPAESTGPVSQLDSSNALLIKPSPQDKGPKTPKATFKSTAKVATKMSKKLNKDAQKTKSAEREETTVTVEEATENTELPPKSENVETSASQEEKRESLAVPTETSDTKKTSPKPSSKIAKPPGKCKKPSIQTPHKPKPRTTAINKPISESKLVKSTESKQKKDKSDHQSEIIQTHPKGSKEDKQDDSSPIVLPTKDSNSPEDKTRRSEETIEKCIEPIMDEVESKPIIEMTPIHRHGSQESKEDPDFLECVEDDDTSVPPQAQEFDMSRFPNVPVMTPQPGTCIQPIPMQQTAPLPMQQVYPSSPGCRTYVRTFAAGWQVKVNVYDGGAENSGPCVEQVAPPEMISLQQNNPCVCEPTVCEPTVQQDTWEDYPICIYRRPQKTNSERAARKSCRKKGKKKKTRKIDLGSDYEECVVRCNMKEEEFYRQQGQGPSSAQRVTAQVPSKGSVTVFDGKVNMKEGLHLVADTCEPQAPTRASEPREHENQSDDDDMKDREMEMSPHKRDGSGSHI